jgi:hypothetical protein
MATLQEIETHIRGVIQNQDMDAMAWATGSNIKIRFVGQYTRDQVEYLINQFAEIYDYRIQHGAGWVSNFYLYQEV